MYRPPLAARVPRAPLFLALLVLLSACAGRPAPEPTPETPPGPYEGFVVGDDPEEPLNRSSITTQPVNFLVTPTKGPANELVIAVNPKDPLNLVAGAKDYALGTAHPCAAAGDGATYPINVWSGVYWSRDGGRTWSDALMPGHPADAANATHPNRAWPCNSDPVVVFGEDGTAYYSGLGIRGPTAPDPAHPCLERNRSVWLMKSTDGGATWKDFSCVASTTALNAGAAGEVVDKQWFAVDGSNVYFTYMEFNPGELDLKFRRSTDGGATWGPELALIETPVSGGGPDAAVGGRQFTMPAVGPKGEVYVIWRSFGSDDGVYFTRSLDQGLTFEAPRRIASITGLPGSFGGAAYRVNSLPVLAVDRGTGPHSGHLYLVWPDYGEGDADIMISRSTDGGLTWTPANLHGNRPEADGTEQFLPWVAVAPGGDVHVAWLDTRNTHNASRLDVYHTVSRDGGDTWAPERRLNALAIETEACRHQSGANFIGDYLGLAASDLAVHPFWPDGRGGKCNGMTATLLR
jgi:hypothetical protein